MPSFSPLCAFWRLQRSTALAAILTVCAAASAQTSVSIHDIMTGLPNSPLLGQNVSTSGIVIGVVTSSVSGSNGGFYISLDTYDRDVNTAEGMFVAASPVAACNAVQVGQVATVTGIVTNTTALNLTAANTPGTYLAPSACSVSGTASMTQTIDLNVAPSSFSDALKYTGMAVSNATFYAVEPTSGTLDASGAAVQSTGQFWATLSPNTATNNHLFRSQGIAGDEYRPAGAPATVPTWSGNPQRVLIDTRSFGGAYLTDVSVGQTITCINSNSSGPGATRGIGLVDYTLGYARIMTFRSVRCVASGEVPVSTSAVADRAHFKVGTLDVNTFLGSASIFQTALSKATLAVTNVFGSPDIFSLQEVGGQDTLQYLASATNSTNGGSTNYVATVLGTDLVNSGFLVNTDTIKNANYIESGRGATYRTPAGSSALLWDYPPLVLTGEFARTGTNYPVTVINVHLTPRDNIGDSTLGPDLRARRAAQAAAVSSLVQQYQSAGGNVIVAGNFNSYEYNDGYVDVVGVIAGSPATADAVTLYQASNTTAALTDFTTQVPGTLRYNVIERGNAAALEHILASATVTDTTTSPSPLASYVNAVTQPHFSTDYTAVSANDPTTPAGLTPHDGFLVSFAIPPVPTSASVSPSSLSFGDVYVGQTKTLTATVRNTTSFDSTVVVSGVSVSGVDAADFTQSSDCTVLHMGNTCTVNVTFAPTAKSARTATLNVRTGATSNAELAVPLTGNGLDTTATLTPVSADYGVHIIGTTSAAMVFTWANSSLIPLAINSVQSSGDYNITSTTCIGTVQAGASCTVSVAFTPLGLQTRAGTLTVISTSSVNGTSTAPLTGIGAADVETDAGNLTFGKADVGSRSFPQAVTVTNYTGAAIQLTNLSVSGDYTEATTCGTTLAAKSSCTISVAFTPTAVGTRTGALVISTNNTEFPVLTIPLTGNGVDFSLAINPAAGNVVAGLGMSAALTLTPLGGFRAPVQLGCTTAALGTACTFSNATLTLSTATTNNLTISTTSQYTVIGYAQLLMQPGSRNLLLTLISLCSGGLLLAGSRSTARAGRLLLALAAFTFAAGLSGCSGKLPARNTPYTAPGTYDIVVTASDGTLTHTAKYSLTVAAK